MCHVQPECRWTQLVAGWATLHLIDFAYGLMKGDLPYGQLGFRMTNNKEGFLLPRLALLSIL
jgi:hypothetical protein